MQRVLYGAFSEKISYLIHCFTRFENRCYVALMKRIRGYLHRRVLETFVTAVFLFAPVSGLLFAEHGVVDPDLPLIAAAAALHDGFPDITIRISEDILGREDDFDVSELQQALVLLGRGLIVKGQANRIDSVLRRYRRIRDRLPVPMTFDLLRGKALLAQNDYARSIAILRPLSELEEDVLSEEIRMAVWSSLAMAYRGSEKYDKAIELFRKFDATYGDRNEGAANLLELAATLTRKSAFEEAQRVYARLASRSAELPEVREGIFMQAQLAVSSGQTNLAESLLLRLVQHEATMPARRAQSWYMLGRLQAAEGRIEDATESMQTLLLLTENTNLRNEAKLELGLLLLKLGRHEESRKLLRLFISANATDERSAVAQLKLADSLRVAGSFDEAEEAYRHYIESFAQTGAEARAREGRGWSLFGLERYSEAASAFERAFNLYEDDEDRKRCLLAQGDAELLAGQNEKAVNSFRHMLNTWLGSPFRQRALFQLGTALSRQGRYDQADAVWSEAIETGKDIEIISAALMQRANISISKRDWQSAVDLYTRLIDMDEVPELYLRDALFARGNARFRAFLFVDALNDYNRVIDIAGYSSLYDAAQLQRALSLYWMGRDAEAVEAVTQFIQNNQNSQLAPEFHYWLARYRYNQREYEEAKRLFVEISQRYPDHRLAVDAVFRAGVSAFNLNEYVMAVEILSGLVANYPDSRRLPDARLIQANALGQLGRYAEAILLYDGIIANYPDHEALAMVFMRKGDSVFTLAADAPERYEESLAAYRAALRHASGDRALVLEGEYKTGRCLEKMGKEQAAVEHYYENVIVRFLAEREEGVWHGESARSWFSRAAFNAVDLLGSQNDWRRAIRILERVIDADVPASAEAAERLATIRSRHWWLY